MSLTPGTRLGPYEIVSPLGAGGMGEVFRARDTKLDREVAIKVLPESFAADADRVARFTREAKTLASLNHPNIAAIYGIEDNAIVMELVEGEDLSAQINRGPIALSDALPLAKQIADALEAAHEQGIIHRDLKPQNIKVRADGTVKVLDFGLAKALSPEGASASADAMNSPTMTARATQMGMIIGTAAYMSPEQARGKAVDKRADIWAFGVVLYEMLSGRRAFEGEDISVTLANVIKDDVKWDALPKDLPTTIRVLLRRCLERDSKKRLRDIGEARVALDAPTDGGLEPSAPSRSSSPFVFRLVAGVAVLATTAAIVAGYVALRPAPLPEPLRLDLARPSVEGAPDSFALSPDGRTVAFVGGESPNTMIYLRPLRAAGAYPLAGSEGGRLPFWSPNGDTMAFFVGVGNRDTQIRKVPVGGGPAQVVGTVAAGAQGTWGRNGDILTSPIGGNCGKSCQLFRLPATGGTAAPLAIATNNERPRWPFFLPDGRHFLFLLLGGDSADSAGIYVGDLETNTRTRLVGVRSSAQYANGHLFYVKDQAVVAQPFDEKSLRITGDPIPVFDNVVFQAPQLIGHFAVSATTLVAKARPSTTLQVLTWLDRAGARTGTLGDPGDVTGPALSPDGRHLAVAYSKPVGAPHELWMWDLERKVFSRLDSRPAETPLFSTDGSHLAFQTSDGIASVIIDGGKPSTLASTPFALTGWSPDGRFLVGGNGGRMTLIEIGKDADRRSLGAGVEPAFSPDGRWVAYGGGNLRGSGPIWIAPFNGGPLNDGRGVQVSPTNGRRPRWRRDGRELYYISDDNQVMAVAITSGPKLTIGVPKPLFAVSAGSECDVAADGQRFICALRVRDAVDPPPSVLLNWPSLLKQEIK